MPELPDIDVYIRGLENLVGGRTLNEIRTGNPFLVRSVTPPLTALHGARVAALRRLGKRVAIGFDNDLWVIIHLMIAGRLHWKSPRPSLAGKQQLAAFDFGHGTLLLTESGSKKRASLYVASGEEGLAEHDPGGIEPLECSREEFAAQLRLENHTLKRALTDSGLLRDRSLSLLLKKDWPKTLGDL